MRVVGGNAARQAESPTPGDLSADYWSVRSGMLRRMHLVARARFAAHRRLAEKANATNIGLQLANFYTISIGIFLLQFGHVPLVKSASGSLGYVSLIASVFVQIMALIESLKDYSGRARSMHGCAVKINSLRQSLDLEQRHDWQCLKWYNDQYQAIIGDYDVNHDPIDYAAAQIDPDSRRERSPEQLNELRWWRVKYLWNVYALTVAILLSPALLLSVLLAMRLG
jgi:hypothetical protein